MYEKDGPAYRLDALLLAKSIREIGGPKPAKRAPKAAARPKPAAKKAAKR